MPALAVPRPEPAGTDANAHRAAVPAALERRLRVCLGDELVDRLFGASSSEPLAERLMTQVMERFRRSRAESDFAVLFDLAAPVLQRRIRHRLRRYTVDIDFGGSVPRSMVRSGAVKDLPAMFQRFRDELAARVGAR
jgi:hypothetical protein